MVVLALNYTRSMTSEMYGTLDEFIMMLKLKPLLTKPTD